MSDRSLRGMRLGSQSMETEAGVEPAARQRVEYRCEDGETVIVTFAAEAEVPPTWTTKPVKRRGWSTVNSTSKTTPNRCGPTGICCWSVVVSKNSKNRSNNG